MWFTSKQYIKIINHRNYCLVWRKVIDIPWHSFYIMNGRDSKSKDKSRCDGTFNCRDNSDELDCPTPPPVSNNPALSHKDHANLVYCPTQLTCFVHFDVYICVHNKSLSGKWEKHSRAICFTNPTPITNNPPLCHPWPQQVIISQVPWLVSLPWTYIHLFCSGGNGPTSSKSF